MANARTEAPAIRDDGLQLDEHRDFQERFWVAERVAWVAFAAIILAALIGLTGAGGPLSRAKAASDGSEISYPRITRWEASDSLTVNFAPGGSERSLTLSPAFAESFQLEDVQPQPDRAEARPEGERLIFSLPAGKPATVTLHVRAHKPGPARYQARIDGTSVRTLSTFILP